MPFLETELLTSAPTISEGLLWAIIAAPLIGWALIVLGMRTVWKSEAMMKIPGFIAIARGRRRLRSRLHHAL